MQAAVVGDYFLADRTLKSVTFFNTLPDKKAMCIYEVLRIDDGHPLLWEDHMERLINSFAVACKILWITPQQLLSKVKLLISANGFKEGNIKLEFRLFENGENQFLSYFIPASYPSDKQYAHGVVCGLLDAERHHPTAKIYNPAVRERANEIIAREDIFETILVNHLSYMTEGSRSNLFFIKDNTLITAPDETVLPGIMRKKVLELANQSNIPVEYRLSAVSELPKMEAVFITGTSLRALPVREIGAHAFNSQHAIYKTIKKELDKAMMFSKELNG
jgi:branched-chain amino acid aminotransferase